MRKDAPDETAVFRACDAVFDNGPTPENVGALASSPSYYASGFERKLSILADAYGVADGTHYRDVIDELWAFAHAGGKLSPDWREGFHALMSSFARFCVDKPGNEMWKPLFECIQPEYFRLVELGRIRFEGVSHA